MKMTPQEIMAEAHRLHDERFSKRLGQLKDRAAERFNETKVDVPAAYKKTAFQHKSNIIDDEGRQVATLIYAIPTPHLPAPSPELQEATTKAEQFITGMHQELEDHYGPVWWQCTLAQAHDNLGWIYTAPKRVAYKGQPKAPADGASEDEKVAYAERNTQYKRDAGISSVFDYEYAVTGTVLYDGNLYEPPCVYVWKEVPESTLRKQYGVYRKPDGSFTKAEPEGADNVPGYVPNSGRTETMVTVVEYWDRDDCLIVAESSNATWFGMRRQDNTAILDEWTHGWGRVPYFARPAFVTEQLDEDKKLAGPLDGIHNEMPSHKRLRTMGDSVAYQTAFAPLKVLTKEQGETIVDADGKPLTFIELEPGKARQFAPGQDVLPVGQSPEVANLYAELAASLQRIERFTQSPVSKGISPGADTANAALSNLHRFQLSTLDPMAEQEARQGRAIYRFWLERIRDMQETVYVLKDDQYLSLSAADIVSVNIQAKATPDQGQQQLLIEKHATELWVARAISKIDMYEMMGYENPEEKARAVEVEDYANTLKPVVWQQVTTLLGLTDAINRMVQQNAQSGQSADAIPQLVEEARGMQDGQMSGMGQGSPGQPRTPGTRMSPTDVNTAAAQTNGIG